MGAFVKALAVLGIYLLMGGSLAVFANESGMFTPTTMTGTALTGSGMAVLDPSVASEAKAIRIFLSRQMAYLTEYGKVIKTYRISSGAAETPTPTGIFQIHHKEDLRVSSQAVPYRMPQYMAFTDNDAFGLHALPYLGSDKEDSAYWYEARSHIGIPVSHGCIRFLPEDAAEIYAWADVGTPVFIRR